MGRNQKLLDRLCSKPNDFTYDELIKLLNGLNCVEDTGGKTSGSRMAFIHVPTQAMLRLHRPHPGNELKQYQVSDVLRFLITIGVI